MKIISTLLVGATALALLPAAANATVSVSSTDYGLDAPAGAGPLVTFDGASGLAGFTLSGSGYDIHLGSDGNGSAPANGPTDADRDTTHYLSVYGGTANLSGSTLYNSVSLFWGSIDGYNTLNLMQGGTVVGTVNAGTIGAGSNGDQLGMNTNRRVNITSDVAFDGLQFVSTSSAFEVDNIKFLCAAVPEPATWAMMIGGIGFAGASLRRARRTTARIAFA
jgi:hypothetical protein